LNQIISLFFPEKLHYENGNYRTKKINQALLLIAQLSSPSRLVENRKADIATGLSTQAPPARLELATL
jgi:hypothetical protein